MIYLHQKQNLDKIKTVGYSPVPWTVKKKGGFWGADWPPERKKNPKKFQACGIQISIAPEKII